MNTNMHKILILATMLVLCSCTVGNEFGRIDQLDGSLTAPDPVEVVRVKSTNGGAVIWVKIPDDKRIKGVIARYERRGEIVNAKVSRYVDSLAIEGYADTEPHRVEVSAFNINEDRSAPVEVDITPLASAIRLVKPTLSKTFGGVKVRIEGNTPRADMAVCILRDADLSDKDKPVGQMKWVEVSTLFTASDNIFLTRRGIEPVEALFGVYLRDRWGNISDTTWTVLTPEVEVQIPKDRFKDGNPGDDNCFSTNSDYPLQGLWDGSGRSDKSHFFACDECPIPAWLTIDMGRTVRLSRIATLPRIAYLIWSNAHPRDFEFWGSMQPTGKQDATNEHGFDDSWFCLGKFIQYKPSGYTKDGLPGTITQEDNDAFNAGNDFELDPDKYPHAYDELRYLRIVFANTFSTFELHSTTGAIQFGEVTPWGQVVD